MSRVEVPPPRWHFVKRGQDISPNGNHAISSAVAKRLTAETEIENGIVGQS
jgi:hypothetical protein